MRPSKADKSKVLVEVKPYSLTLGSKSDPSMLLFREVGEGQRVLPVPLSPLDAAVVLGMITGARKKESPHDWTKELFDMAGMKLEQAIFFFEEDKGLGVALQVEKKSGAHTIVISSESSMSLCLYHDIKFFCAVDVFASLKKGLLNPVPGHPGISLEDGRPKDGYLH